LTRILVDQQLIEAGWERIYASHNWTQIQRRWLDRLAKQLTHEVVIDQQFVNQRFSADGGAKKLNTMFGGQLDQVLDQFTQGFWSQSA
jgi:type I restriction enzyme R subunit